MSNPTLGDAARSGDFHRLLLRVAGHAPDELLAAARTWLAQNTRLDDVARAIYGVAVDREIPLVAADVELLGSVVPDDPVVRMLTGDEEGTPNPPLPLAFSPIRPRDGQAPDPLPLTDLTTSPDSPSTPEGDDVDTAAIAAFIQVPGAVAVWRTWRMRLPARPSDQPTRVYIAEVDLPVSDLPAATAHMQESLTEAGVEHPQVEVYSPGTELPTYQRMARGHAALLWASRDGTPVEIARVFDRVDPVEGPQFLPDHDVLTDTEREQVLQFLRSGLPLLVTTERSADILDSSRGPVVPMSFRTDGRWIWTDTVSYYLETYGLSPDVEMLAHIRQTNYRTPVVDAVAEHRALAKLLKPAEAPPVWTA
jgi:hypothetical protein